MFWRHPPWHGGKAKYRLGLAPINIEAWFPTAMTPDVFAHKARLLQTAYQQVVAVMDNSKMVNAAQNALANQRPETLPQHPDLIANLAMQVPDDLCLVQIKGKQRLIAACVCSPSYWDIQTKIGKPLREIHAPVKSLDIKIGDPIQRFVKNAPLMRPFERANWFIHDDTQRFHNASDHIMKNTPEQWFIRSERETLCALNEEYLLFTINPRFQPLADIARYPDAQKDLLTTMASFDEDEIEYFGGPEKHRRVIAYVERL